jgi:hypothetical protein
MRRYSEDIGYVPKGTDRAACGWMSEVAGYADGYVAAQQDVERNIKRFGKDRTAQYLKKVENGEDL